jgi:hypothetical protein
MLDKLFGFRRSGLLPHRLFPDTILAKIANRSLPDGEFLATNHAFLTIFGHKKPPLPRFADYLTILICDGLSRMISSPY